MAYRPFPGLPGPRSENVSDGFPILDQMVFKFRAIEDSWKLPGQRIESLSIWFFRTGQDF
jgi:hypothetical protein